MTTPIVPHDSENLKRCTKCGIEYPATAEYFHRTKRIASGLQARCKQCACKNTQTHYAANREECKRKRRERYLGNPGKARQISKKYRDAHADEINARNRAAYANDPEPRKAAARAYRLANLERAREYDRKRAPSRAEEVREWKKAYYAQPHWKLKRLVYKHKRRALERGADGHYSAEDIVAIRAAQTDKQGRLICWRCGKPITDTPHLDHWIPLNGGGSNNPGNLHFMHAKCNQTKSAKMPTEIGRLL